MIDVVAGIMFDLLDASTLVLVNQERAPEAKEISNIAFIFERMVILIFKK